MANPLDYVTPQFWEVAQDFDKLLSQMPVKLGPITPHLHQLRRVDTARIRHVASLWRNDRGDLNNPSLAEAVTNAASQLDYITNDLIAWQGWDGDAFVHFQSLQKKMSQELKKIDPTTSRMADSLNHLADSVDNALTHLVSILSGLAGIIAALVSVSAGGIWIVSGGVSLIQSSISSVQNLIKIADEEQAAVQQMVDECTSLISSLKINPS